MQPTSYKVCSISTSRRQAQMHFAIYCNNQRPALIIAKTMNTIQMNKYNILENIQRCYVSN